MRTFILSGRNYCHFCCDFLLHHPGCATVIV